MREGLKEAIAAGSSMMIRHFLEMGANPFRKTPYVYHTNPPRDIDHLSLHWDSERATRSLRELMSHPQWHRAIVDDPTIFEAATVEHRCVDPGPVLNLLMDAGADWLDRLKALQQHHRPGNHKALPPIRLREKRYRMERAREFAALEGRDTPPVWIAGRDKHVNWPRVGIKPATKKRDRNEDTDPRVIRRAVVKSLFTMPKELYKEFMGLVG